MGGGSDGGCAKVMFKRIHIQNFRSCADVTLDSLGSITALVGRNGAGKTNLLRAIHWLARTATASEPIAAEVLRPSQTSLRMSVEVELPEGFFRYSLGRHLFSDKARGRVHPSGVLVSLDETLEVRDAQHGWSQLVNRSGDALLLGDRPDALNPPANSPCLPVLTTVLSKDDPISRQIHPLLTFFSRVRYYPLDEPSDTSGSARENFIRGDAYVSWLGQQRAGSDPGSAVVNRLVHMDQEHPEQMRELKSLLGPDGIGLIDDLLVEEIDVGPATKDEPEGSRRYYFVSFHPTSASGGDQSHFAYNDLSAGTRRTIRILVSLIYDRSSVMLLEQPEDSIHSGLMKKLIDLLRANANPGQLIMATHSPSVFNRLEPGEVRLVTMNEGQTQARLLSQGEVQAAEAFITAEGTFADFLRTVQEE